MEGDQNKKKLVKQLIKYLSILVLSAFISGCMIGKAMAADLATMEAFTSEQYPYASYAYKRYDGVDTHYILISNIPVYYIDSSLTMQHDNYILFYDDIPINYKLYCSTTTDTVSAYTQIEAQSSQTSNVIIDKNWSIIKGNHTIYEAYRANAGSPYYKTTNVFFYSSSQPEHLPSPPELPELVQPQALLPAQAQLLLLLPLLIPLVVGFLGLRKGLAILRTILNKG